MNTLTTLDIHSIPDEFFIELAVGALTFGTVCEKYNLDADQVEALEDSPRFVQRLEIARQEVTDDGRAFKTRCRIAVNDSVKRVIYMMQDPDVPAAVRLDAFKTLAKYGELEPAPKQANAVASGPTLTLNIIAPTGETHRVIDVQPPEDDDEPYLLATPASLATLSAFNAA